MNCLKDYIGIIGYGSQEPLSGLFLNQLPGISLESMDKIADRDQVNFAGVWKDVQTRAWLRLEKDFRIALRKRFRLSALKAFAHVRPVVGAAVVVPAEKYRGLVVRLDGHRYEPGHGSKSRAGGAFLCVHIGQINVKLTADCPQLTVKIFDGAGAELDSFTKTDVPAGDVVIHVSRKYPVQEVFVAVDAEAVPLYTASLSKEVEEACCAALFTLCDSCSPQFFPAEAAKGTPGGYTRVSNYFGIGVSYSAVCDYTAVICSTKEEFMDVWLYLLGAELMLERLYTSRLNAYTTIDRKEAAETRDFFTVEYEKRLAETVAGLEISKDDSCIECNPMYTQKVRLP